MRGIGLVAGVLALLLGGVACGAGSPAAPEPTFGIVHAAHEVGFGTVRPSEIFNGGTADSEVDGIVWSGWGGAKATGRGSGFDTVGAASLAMGHPAPMTLVADDLGTCGGRRVYRELVSFFPSEGQTVATGVTENLCTGASASSAG